MPELPEVERARKLIADSCTGHTIASVQVTGDSIVYTGGTDHDQFAKELTGRTITGCERKGKMFWMTLSGSGLVPVMHFGMTGMIQFKGDEPTWYRRRPKESVAVWPPKYYKFILVLDPQDPSADSDAQELAFIDPRRLARIRLLPTPPLSYPPLSLLGFDPVLSHPSLPQFTALLQKKKGTVKGVIMDQSFSAGIGNWLADEILFQAQIHPSHPTPLLGTSQIAALHHLLRAVPTKAVEVDADSTKFPDGWLFKWRWGKGKKGKGGGDVEPDTKNCLVLKDGRPGTIEWITVGGRTSAFVQEVQKMPEGVQVKVKGKRKRREEESESAGASGDESASEQLQESKGKRKRAQPAKVITKKRPASAKSRVKEEGEGGEVEEEKVPKRPRTARQMAMDEKKLGRTRV